MARLIPLLPAPRENLPVPYAQPPGLGVVSADSLSARRSKPGLPVPRAADPGSVRRRRASRWVCDHYRPGTKLPDRGMLCDFST